MVFYFVTVFSCKESEVGSGFSGQISKTKYGMSCQTWETVPAIIIPHVWKSQDVALTTQYLPRLKNFCRNQMMTRMDRGVLLMLQVDIWNTVM